MKNLADTSKYRLETLQVHAGQEQPDPATDARAVPIYMTTSYVFKDSATAAGRFALSEPGNIYTRLMNPTSDVFEKRIAALEGGIAALATASGSAAITYAIQNIALAGDHVVASTNLYGGTYNLLANTLREQGIETTFVDPSDPKNFEKAIKANTKLLYTEVLGNPNSDVTDIDAIAEIAHRHKIALVVDNTFASPYIFRPLEHGADVVVESATKFISGHGTVLGGVIVESGKTPWMDYKKYTNLSEPDPSYHGFVFAKSLPDTALVSWIRCITLRDIGACISPVNAFALLVSLETLSLRIDKQVDNALKIVDYLKKNPKVKSVSHPSLPDSPTHALYQKYFPNGAGCIFTFDVNGTKEQTQKLTESLKIFSLLANVADEKSLIIHPASTTHSQLTEEELASVHISPQTVRISVGAENIRDLIADLEQAFAQI